MTPDQIIDRLGGAAPLSKRLKLPPTTVGNWHARKSIPARYHHAVLLASDGALTADELVAAHAGEADHAPDAGHEPCAGQAHAPEAA